MKVASKKPAAVKRPVYITKNRYEIYYSKPACLGVIDNVGGYWFTQDGLRFVSSRDAMNYLINQHDKGTLDLSNLSLIPVKPVADSVPDTVPVKPDAPVPEVKPAPAPTKTTTSDKKKPDPVKPEKQEKTKTPEPVNQNHPMFQEFLKFVDYRNKQRNGNGDEKVQ